MKKAKKQCLGFFGLGLVAAMTMVAVNLPAPEASATSTITDTLVVRVVGDVPDVNIHGVTNDAIYVEPEKEFTVDYENVETASVSVEYTDPKGNVFNIVLSEITPDYEAGTEKITIPMVKYGYGKYIINAKGIGYDGVYDEDSILFYYLPINARVDIDALTDKQYVDMDYLAADDDPETPGEVAKIILNVYDESGKLVEALSGITVNPPTNRVEIPFAEKNMPSGTYRIAVSAYGTNGELLYEPLMLTTTYTEAVVPDAGAPDTGGLFQNLNISKEDYLISGLIVFFVLGIVAFGVVARNRKTNTRRPRR